MESVRLVDRPGGGETGRAPVDPSTLVAPIRRRIGRDECGEKQKDDDYGQHGVEPTNGF